MYMTYEALGVMRISEMFDIVVDYPDSHPAVSMNYYGVAVYIKKAHTQTHTHTHVSRVLLS